MGRRRQFRQSEPCNLVMFLGRDVLRRPLPLPHQPSTEERRRVCRSRGHSSKVRHRARRYLYTEFLVQFPSERAQLRLASLDHPTG
jgi:hypothetical protein